MIVSLALLQNTALSEGPDVSAQCGVEPRQVAARSGQLWQWAASCIEGRLHVE